MEAIMAFPVSIQLFSLNEDLEKDARYVFTELSKMGYEGVEPFGGRSLYGMTPEEFIALMNELGLKVPSAHISFETLMADPDDTFSFHKSLGCKYLTIPYMYASKMPGGECYEAIPEQLSMLCEKAKEYGMVLCYHNHEGEFKRLGDKYIMDHFMADVPELKAEYDTAWIAVMNEKPAKYIRENSDRCALIHIKDFYRHKDIREGRGELRPVGYGNQNIPDILDAAREAGTEWIVVEQDKPAFGLSNLECARMSIEYLKFVNR